mgnify:CR=1 FL=1
MILNEVTVGIFFHSDGNNKADLEALIIQARSRLNLTAAEYEAVVGGYDQVGSLGYITFYKRNLYENGENQSL